MKKVNLFDGLLDYKEPKETKVRTNPGKVSSSGFKTKAFPKSRTKKVSSPKVKEPKYDKFRLSNPEKHPSGWI